MRYRYRSKVKRKKDRWREGGRDKEIDRYGVRKSVWWGEIKRKIRRDGWIYRYIWGREGRRFPVVDTLISV